MNKVLIVEDDQHIVDLLDIHLKDLDCQLTKTHDGNQGFEYAVSEPYDLIILDIMLPGMDGVEICRKVRAKEIHTPILMLTAKSEEIDKVLGLETGADDYLTKPFSIREFIARVKAILRRNKLLHSTSNGQSVHLIETGALSIDLEKRKVSCNGSRVDLTPKEFDLLSLLATNPGKSYKRSQILNLVWGYDFEGYEHTVNSHINRLRSKIEPNLNDPTYILTSWGVGYRFAEL